MIPTLGQQRLVCGQRRVMVVEAVRSLLARTEHQNVELVVVHDAPTPPEVLDAAPRGRRRPPGAGAYAKPFNYSEKMNLGAVAATGERWCSSTTTSR